MRTLLTVLCVLTFAAQALAFPDTMPIVPGQSIGPVRLGMPEAAARQAAAAWEKASGCTIDLTVAGGVVTAIGTRYGACLWLEPPPALVTGGPIVLGIGGDADAMAAAFGIPLTFPIGLTDYDDIMVTLVWPHAGLAAVAVFDHLHLDEPWRSIITAVAVIPIGQEIPPYALVHGWLSDPANR